MKTYYNVTFVQKETSEVINENFTNKAIATKRFNELKKNKPTFLVMKKITTSSWKSENTTTTLFQILN